MPTPMPASTDIASRAYARWEAEYGDTSRALSAAAPKSLLPDVSMPSDPEQFADAALTRLRTEQKQLSNRASQGRVDIARYATAQDERDVALRQRDAIDEEVARLSTNAGTLGSGPAELSSFIANDICPVCDRDFSEMSKVPLIDMSMARCGPYPLRRSGCSPWAAPAAKYRSPPSSWTARSSRSGPQDRRGSSWPTRPAVGPPRGTDHELET